MDKIVELLINLSIKSLKNGDVPVSCIITRNNIIIAKSYNKKMLNNDPTAHAEINCIRSASKKLKTSNLGDCELYTLLYPCPMCKEVIKESRIKKVYFILKNPKIINDTILYNQLEISNEKYNKIRSNLLNFFKDKR